jgi:hypothetical protein
MLAATGCQSGGLSCMRQVSEADLIKAQQAATSAAYPQYYEFGDFYFGPTIDGKIVQDLPSKEFQRGHFTKVSTTGTTVVILIYLFTHLFIRYIF